MWTGRGVLRQLATHWELLPTDAIVFIHIAILLRPITQRDTVARNKGGKRR